jgi:hypothetical protein
MNTIGQNLVICQIDANTRDTVKATGWIILKRSPNLFLQFRAVQKNSVKYLDIKLSLGPDMTFSISDTNFLQILCTDRETITLKSRENQTSRKGMASEQLWVSKGITIPGVWISYAVPNEVAFKLESKIIEKITIYLNTGHVEIIPDLNLNSIPNAIRQISVKYKKYKIKPVYY